MINSAADQKQGMTETGHTYLRSAESVMASSEQVVRRAIVKNPGIALAISAAIGVMLACLIKRR